MKAHWKRSPATRVRNASANERVTVVAEPVLYRRRRRREARGAPTEHPGGEFGGVAELFRADPQRVQVGLVR